jgi:hypothetical protein
MKSDFEIDGAIYQFNIIMEKKNQTRSLIFDS